MPPSSSEPDTDLPAGDFATWLAGVQVAIRGERASIVPCGGCTACCRSAQFIDIGPDETDTLAHIPPALLFPAPGRPAGHVLLGHDEHGHCPMLVDDACSIYRHRPAACRAYDCRVFPATGLRPDDGDERQQALARQVRRWRFTFRTPADRDRHDAVQAAARFARAQPHAPATSATGLAVQAIEIHEQFLADGDESRAARRS